MRPAGPRHFRHADLTFGHQFSHIKYREWTRSSSLAQGYVLSAGSRNIMHTEKKNKKNPCGLDLWSMTLKFNRVLIEVVELHVRAKFHAAECSGSWVIVVTAKKTPTKTILPSALVATADSKYTQIGFTRFNICSPVLRNARQNCCAVTKYQVTWLDSSHEFLYVYSYTKPCTDLLLIN